MVPLILSMFKDLVLRRSSLMGAKLVKIREGQDVDLKENMAAVPN